MRGIGRANDNTLRWALVGGIIVVVVIATVLAISSIFSGSSKPKAVPPPVKVPAAGYCLLPTRVGLSAKELKPFKALAAAHTPTAKHALIRAERIIRRHSNLPPVVSPSAKHFVFLNRKGRIVLGTAGGKSHVFKIKAVDVAFNGKGTKIIYQKPALAHHTCAHLVLMEMTLTGKHRHLMLGSGSFDLANSAGTPIFGVLHQDQLPSGQIVLIHGENLYAFNAGRRRIGMLESKKLGLLYNPKSATPVTAPSFIVSPGSKFVVTAGFGKGPAVYKLPTWTRVGAALPTISLSNVAWSYNGKILAFPSAAGASIVIDHVTTGKMVTVSWPKKFHAMQISALRWARDDHHIGFNGTSLTNPGSKPIAFISRTMGKHLVAHAVSQLKPSKKGSSSATT